MVREGVESLWSPVRHDTPRFESRNVVVYARQVDPTRAGFRFYYDLDGDGAAERAELGLVRNAALGDADFTIERDGSGGLSLTPLRSGTGVVMYGSGPVDRLTDVDVVRVAGHSREVVQVRPGHAYVFETSGGDGFAGYGAVRVSHAGQEFLILDWSWQGDPGNPELLQGG